MGTRSLLSLLAASLLGLLTPARAEVLVVAEDHSGDFTDLPSAVAAAASGDIIIVMPGSYAAPTLGDKSLTLVAVPGTVQLGGGIEIKDLAAADTILLRGFRAPAGSQVFGPSWVGLWVHGCDGAVRFEDCTFTGTHGWTGPFGQPGAPDGIGAVKVVSSDDVVFTHCNATGGFGLGPNQCRSNGGLGANAVDVFASRAAFFGGTYEGGNGAGGGSCVPSGSGGAGIGVLGLSQTHVQGIVARGGHGGIGLFPGAGGAGVFSNGLSISVVDCELIGGESGTPGEFTPGLLAVNESVFPGPASEFKLPAPLLAGQWGTLLAQGLPGELVVVLFSGDTSQLPLQGGASLALVPLPAILLPIGTTDSTGALGFGFPVPALPPSIEGLVAHAQAAFVGAGGWRLGPSSSVVIVAWP